MVRLPIPQRLSSHLSSKTPTPGQSRTPSPSRVSEKPLILKVAVLKVSNRTVPLLFFLYPIVQELTQFLNAREETLRRKIEAERVIR